MPDSPRRQEPTPADNVLARRKQDRKAEKPEKVRPEVVEKLLALRRASATPEPAPSKSPAAAGNAPQS
jgi:hypothetical protein